MENNVTPFSVDHFSLSGRTALITGVGGRGNSIGRAFSFGLASVGAQVVVADIVKAGAESVAAEVIERGGSAIAVEVDITDPASVGTMAQAARDAFGGVDILVNNAALTADLHMKHLYGSTIDCPIDEWNRILAVNLTGALNCCQAIVPMMRERSGGRIVNMISAGAFPAGSAYGVSKLALVGLTTTLAAELGKSGINVNAIAPGNTGSDAGKAVVASLQATAGASMASYLEAMVTLRSSGVPDDLVGALLLLCSQAGSWIHGQVLHVDGGWILRP